MRQNIVLLSYEIRFKEMNERIRFEINIEKVGNILFLLFFFFMYRAFGKYVTDVKVMGVAKETKME